MNCSNMEMKCGVISAVPNALKIDSYTRYLARFSTTSLNFRPFQGILYWHQTLVAKFFARPSQNIRWYSIAYSLRSLLDGDPHSMYTRTELSRIRKGMRLSMAR